MSFDIDPNKLFEKESLSKRALQWLFVVYTTIKMAESLVPGSSEPALRSAMAKIARVTKQSLRGLWQPLGYRQEMSRRRRDFLDLIEIIGIDVPIAAWFWVFGLLCSIVGAVRPGLSAYQRIGCFITFGLAMLVHKWFANSAHMTLERLRE